MTLYKNLGGEQVAMSAEEEAAIRAEWEANAPQPVRRMIPKGIIVERLIAAGKIDAARAALAQISVADVLRSIDGPLASVRDIGLGDLPYTGPAYSDARCTVRILYGRKPQAPRLIRYSEGYPAQYRVYELSVFDPFSIYTGPGCTQEAPDNAMNYFRITELGAKEFVGVGYQ